MRRVRSNLWYTNALCWSCTSTANLQPKNAPVPVYNRLIEFKEHLNLNFIVNKCPSLGLKWCVEKDDRTGYTTCLFRLMCVVEEIPYSEETYHPQPSRPLPLPTHTPTALLTRTSRLNEDNAAVSKPLEVAQQDCLVVFY